MSKYQPLWDYVMNRHEDAFVLSFLEIQKILHFEIDHSFLNHQKELAEYGYQVDKISLKNKTVQFKTIKS